MASERQLRANRENAMRSTGPKTAAGRSKASRNALRHAFPDRRAGTIKVRYRFEEGSWTLSVTDNGVGIGRRPERAGLGTSVVEVLARQLGADYTLVSSDAGTTASVAGRQRLPAFAPRVAASGRR